MIIGIHQPNFMPWHGYYEKMKKSDLFVFLDNVKYSKNSFFNRNKFSTNSNEFCWITVPVPKKFTKKKLNEVVLTENAWIRKHIRFFEQSYSKTNEKKYLSSILDIYRNAQDKKEVNLAEFNMEIINVTKNHMGIECEIVKASELTIRPSLKKQDLVIGILDHLGGKKYISGTGASDYQDELEFKKSEIELEYLEPIIKREMLYNGSVMSATDYIFREGSCYMTSMITSV